jgi:hypothetical protein
VPTPVNKVLTKTLLALTNKRNPAGRVCSQAGKTSQETVGIPSHGLSLEKTWFASPNLYVVMLILASASGMVASGVALARWRSHGAAALVVDGRIVILVAHLCLPLGFAANPSGNISG